MKIIVHGGAGKIPEADKEERKSVLERAAEQGIKEERPLAGVEAAIRILEGFPLFNAGFGGSFQLDGEVRLDAAVAKSDLSTGGVINVEGVQHPITLANSVRKRTPHALLQGEGAVELARNLELDVFGKTKSKRDRENWEEISEKLSGLSYPEELEKLKQLSSGQDTVGAVAASSSGELAAGTSTGGVRNQMKGRVGDSPILGAGLYCNETGGVSTTGKGEAIIKVNLARELVHQLENGADLDSAANSAIEKLEDLTGSRAGLISLDSSSNSAAAYNTRDMQYVVRTS